MKQLYRIRCKTETCAWWYMGGKTYSREEAISIIGKLTLPGYLLATLSFADNESHVTDIFVETCLADHNPAEIDTF